MTLRNVTILLAEDRLEDQVMIERVLESGKIKCDLVVVENGAEALKVLRERAASRELPSIDFVLMDINMPIMDGKQALVAIRKDEKIMHTPVIMLTTSNREKDVIESYRLGVNAYLTKPVDTSAFIDAIKVMEKFWFNLVTLP